MAIYKVFTPEIEGVVHVIHAPSMGAAKAARRGFAEGFSLKLNDVEIVEAEIKSGKAGTIAYLNAFHAQVPATYTPTGDPKSVSPRTPAKKAAKKAAKKK